jgi:hypothetical protein
MNGERGIVKSELESPKLLDCLSQFEIRNSKFEMGFP